MFGTYNRLNLHVADSNRDVIRAARQRLNKRAQTGREYRDARHAFFREMIAYHAEARDLYLFVAKGTL